jgi:hypothetical protein
MSSTVIQGASFSSNAWKSTVSYKNIRYKETFDFAGLSKCLPYLSCPPLSPCYNIVHESRHAALDTRFPNLNALHTGCPSWHHNHNHLRYSRLLGPKQNTKQRSRLQCVLQKWRWIFREYLSFSFFVFVDRFSSANCCLHAPQAYIIVSANPGKLSGCGSVYADSSMNLLTFFPLFVAGWNQSVLRNFAYHRRSRLIPTTCPCTLISQFKV